MTCRSPCGVDIIQSRARLALDRVQSSPLSVKFDPGFAEPDGIGRRDRNRSVDAEDCDLELVARPDRIGQHDAIRHVEALDRRGAGIANAARYLPIDPDLGV